LVGEPLETREALVAAARALLNGPHAPETVVVSLGGDGALFLTHEQALHAHPVKVAVTSTVGAGDAMVAGLVAARLENRSLFETAQLATAFSASKLTRLGPHLPPPDQVRALARQVAVSTID
jgi:1-phosphofructokinase